MKVMSGGGLNPIAGNVRSLIENNTGSLAVIS